MLFNSPVFIFCFLPTVLIVFYLAGHAGRPKLAILWLIAASLFFYGYWNPRYLPLIGVSILVNYALGVWLSHHALTGNKKNLVLGLGIALNLSLLAYFKYANFFLDSLNELGMTHVQMASIILPLGISFFTFNQTAYLVDAWHGEAKEYNLLHYAVFVLFFPHLIAGPIIHHKEMVPQFTSEKIYRFSHFNLALGLSIFLVGLFKKVVIADNLAPFATTVFNAAEHGETLQFFDAWKGIAAYTLQLYFDFSGYSDMAIGLARMFGIHFPLNFDSPYKAINIIDFWRRWHMTLSRFLRDYIYVPLGGNRKGKMRRYVNLMITMLLGGLWHGAGWTFVFWGFLHGLYLIINHAWRRLWTIRINKWWSVGIARFVTLVFVMIAWVFFRAKSFEGALHLFGSMTTLPSNLADKFSIFTEVLLRVGFHFNGPRLSSDDVLVLTSLLVLFAAVWFLPNTQEFFAKYHPAYGYSRTTLGLTTIQTRFRRMFWRPTIAWSVWIGVLAGLSLLSLSHVSEFLYYEF